MRFFPYKWFAYVEYGDGKEPVALGAGDGQLGEEEAKRKLEGMLSAPDAPEGYGRATFRVCGGDPFEPGFVREYSIGPDVGNEWSVYCSEPPERKRETCL